MTFDLISGLHMQIQTWHPPLWLCTHAKYYVKTGLTNVLKNANKTKNMHLFSIWIANYAMKYISQDEKVLLDKLNNMNNEILHLEDINSSLGKKLSEAEVLLTNVLCNHDSFETVSHKAKNADKTKSV